MKRIIFFLIDGLSEMPRNNTPLSLARKSSIDKLLPFSFLGKFYPLKKNEWPKDGYASISQYANLGILGYKINDIYIKRGPIEAVGSEPDTDSRGPNADKLGFKYRNGWLAMRIDFGAIDKDFRVIDRRAGRNIWGLDEIVNDLNKIKFEIPFLIKRTYGHRGVLIFKKRLSDKISNSDPLKIGQKILKIKPLSKDKLSLKTAIIVQEFLEFAYKKLSEHPITKQRIAKGLLPINYLLTREAGNRLPRLNNFFTTGTHHLTKICPPDGWTENGLVVAENGVVKGTCKLAGFETLTVPEIALKKQFDFIFDAIEKNSEKYNLIYAHIKGADEAAHDKNCSGKKEIIEIFDRYFGKLAAKLEIENITYIITGDHITDCKTGQHKFGPVPVLFIDKDIKSNNPKEFSEISAKKETKNIWGDLGDSHPL